MACPENNNQTQKKMSIAHLFFNDMLAEADTSEFIGESEKGHEEKGKEHKKFNQYDLGFKALARVARLCSRAKFKPMQGDVPIFRREISGDASEAAILRFMETQFKNVKKYRSKHKILCELPFNPRTKCQVFVHEIVENKQTLHLLTMKGAPEKVLKHCNRLLIADQEVELTHEWRAKVEKALESMGSLGERVIGFADGILPPSKYNSGYVYDSEKPEFLNIPLRFVGLMSMIDPPRAAVPSAIAKCRSAGVRIIMVTGDHPSTAIAIGRAVGIISEGVETREELSTRKKLPQSEIPDSRVGATVISGSQLKRMDESQLMAAILGAAKNDLIFARTTPVQKFRVVETLQNLGALVTVIGDGVNDSPALKKADVGICMGITGTEVSKAIADVVLLDDNFSSVVSGIEEGRLGFENLKKILAYSLVDNVAEAYCFCICILADLPLPLGTMAILLTVLGTDLAPAFSLMYEGPERELMKVQPRNPKKEKLITGQLLSHVYLQVAVLEAVAGYFAYFCTMASYGFMPWSLIGRRKAWESRGINDMEDSWGQEWTFSARKKLETYSQTAFFVSIVIMQIANVIACKTRKQSIIQKKMTNWYMNFAILVALGLTSAIIYIPPLASFFGMMSLRSVHWLLPLPFAFFLLFFDELRRLFLRKNAKCGTDTILGAYLEMLSF